MRRSQSDQETIEKDGTGLKKWYYLGKFISLNPLY